MVKIIDLDLDSTVENQDWIKKTWDLYHGTVLVTTYDDLRSVLGTDEKIKNFLHLPSARAMPDSLRSELESRGFDVPPKVETQGAVMPWHIVQGHSGCPDSKPYAVVKDSDGTVEGCHASRSQAEDQMAALYANESATSNDQGLRKEGATLPASGGTGMTAAEVDLTDDTEDLGGKPSKGTKADRRLRVNKRDPQTPKTESDDVAAFDSTPDLPVQWSGVLVPEGVPTGDGREFAKDSVSWVDPPMPLRWQKEGAHGGQNDVTVQVGLITRVWREGNNIMGEGHFDLGGPENDDPHEAFRRMGAGTATGVSIDADDITSADIEYVFPESDGETEEDDILFMLFAQPEKVIFHSARIRAATLCDIPAFVEARLHLLTPEESAALSASAEMIDQSSFGAVGVHTTATSDGSWDGPANEARLPVPVPMATARKAYAYIDDGAETDGAVPKSACRFIHHEVSADGTPGAANLTACSTGIGVLHGGRGGTTIPTSARRGVYDHLAKHLRDGGQEPPPYQSQEVITASALSPEWKPPASWFSDPHLGQVMPIMVTDQGRVYGHAAQWGQCHLGYMNECVMPPFEDFHSYYRTGEVLLDNGSRAQIGVITAGIEHARLSMNATAAKEHYENTDAMVAYVISGNDKHGIWVAGAILPWAQEARVSALRASGQVSPDWRRIGGSLRMVGLLTVNVSGYQTQMPKARALVASGEIQALVASGMISVQTPTVTKEDLDRRALELIRQQLVERMHGKGE